MSTKKEIDFYNSIDRIFWEQWDPIGIHGDIRARNEYYGYIPNVFQEAMNNRGEEEIAKTLFEIEKKRIGLDGNYKKCLIAAREILREKSRIFE